MTRTKKWTNQSAKKAAAVKQRRTDKSIEAKKYLRYNILEYFRVLEEIAFDDQAKHSDRISASKELITRAIGTPREEIVVDTSLVDLSKAVSITINRK